jgi:outer membrane protein assembly factor BamA
MATRRLAQLIALLALLSGRARADDFGPSYLVESIAVRGNVRTDEKVIVRQLTLHAGEVVRADDPRVEVSRFRVIALGYFSDVSIRLERGSERGKVVLVVDVVERGTMILNQLFLGTSDYTPIWGGLDVSENNWFGRGFGLGGAFLVTTRGDVPLSRPQQAYRLRFSSARIFGTPLSVALTALYNNASEPFRIAGSDDDDSPNNFRAVGYKRAGGIGGLGIEAGAYLRLAIDYRLERIDAQVPDALYRTYPGGITEAVDVGLHPGVSWISSLTLTFDYDTRNDPVLPTDGSKVLLTGEVSTRAVGSDYEYFKATAFYQRWFKLPWRHVLSTIGTVGVITGDSPLFDRYYIGDINPLVPQRALGLTLSTLPSRNLLGTGIARERYGNFAARLGFEYLWPLFRGGNYFYGGHLFLGAGGLALATFDDLRQREGTSLWRSLPLDIYFDAGIRLDTYIGIFTLSIANFLGRLPL